MRLMSIRIFGVLMLTVLVALLAAACGDDSEPYEAPEFTPTPESTAPTQSAGTPTPFPPVTELRVAFVNLLHPLDPGNVEANETYEQRLTLLIEELREFQPDVVAVVEASWTEEHGNAVTRMAEELRMEFQPARSNPWAPDLSKEELDSLVEQFGREEGVAILSRYPILEWESQNITPLTSPFENRVALHVVIRGPEQVGEVDLYVTQLTSSDPEIRASQASDVAAFIGETRGGGNVIVFGDLNDIPEGSAPARLISEAGLGDVLAVVQPPLSQGTCCREGVTGEQAPPGLRTSYVLTAGWLPQSAQLIGEQPAAMLDGSLLYVSDQNGIGVTFPLPDAPAEVGFSSAY